MAPPLGLYRLRQFIGERGYRCDIGDLDLPGVELEDYLAMVSAGEYDLVGLSVSHTNMNFDLRSLWALDKARRQGGNRVLLIAGGQEATLNYRQWLKTGLDLIVLGYGEKTLLELCRRVTEGCRTHKEFADLPGIVMEEENGRYRLNPAEKLTQQSFTALSYHLMLRTEIPFPTYWDRFKATAETLNFTSSRFVLENVRLYTSSHCPGGCGFCSSQAFLPASQQGGHPIFLLSAGEVFHLVQHAIANYGAKSFLFSDDDFVIGSKAGLERVQEFCALITAAKEQGIIDQGTMFNCQAKIADFIRREPGAAPSIRTDLIEAMARAGFHSMGMGVETFSDALLQSPSINKAGISRHDIETVLRALLAGGITPQINIILGIPETSVTDLIETMRLAVTYLLAGCQMAVMPRLLAFPGSPVCTAARHPVRSEEHTDPFTGNRIENTLFLEPRDKKVVFMVENLEKSFQLVVERMREESGRMAGNLPKSLLGICYFIAAAELLGDTDAANEFTAVVRAIAGNDTRHC